MFRHEDAPRGTFCAFRTEAKRDARWGVVLRDLVAATTTVGAAAAAGVRTAAAPAARVAGLVAAGRSAAVVVVTGAVVIGGRVVRLADRVVVVARAVLVATIVVDEAGVAGDDTSQQRCVHRAAVIGSCRGCERVAASGEEAEESALLFVGLRHWVSLDVVERASCTLTGVSLHIIV